MSPKKRIGLQIRFNPESEKDLVDFFSTMKKAEVHITAISAFRMYMRQVGFYDNLRLENCYSPNVLKEKKGLEDEEAFRTLDGMFDNENELND